MIARIALSLALVTGLAGTAAAQTLMVHVSYREGAPLGRTAVLEVTLEDVSDANAPAVIIGSTRMPRPGQGPILFSLDYDAARVVPGGRYTLRAHIADGATTLFESARPVRVLTQGTGSVASVTLVQREPGTPVETTSRAPKSADAASTPAPQPESALKPAPALKTMPTPTPAPKTTRAPKPMPAPKATPAPKPPAAPKATPAAEPAPAPKPKPAPTPQPTPASPPALPPAPAPSLDAAPLAIAGVEWTMTEIKNRPVRPASKTHRKISLVFDEGHGTFSGTSGCNDLAGRFDGSGGKLTLKSDKSLRICRVDQKTERAVRSVINDTRAYRISGTTLDLLNERGQRLAKLERHQLPR